MEIVKEQAQESLAKRYQMMRDKNIKERQDLFKTIFTDDEPGGKVKEGASKEKRVKKTSSASKQPPVRRSARKRKNVNYDEEYTIRSKKVKSNSKKDLILTVDKSDRSGFSQKNLRPRKPVVYDEELPKKDDFVFCETCQSLEYQSCESHPLNFASPSSFSLEIGPSCVVKNSGEGVFNRGHTIPTGIIFGPYKGNFFTTEIYEKVKEGNRESGNAWEIMDEDLETVVGVCDPGCSPDSSENWMSKINCCVYKGNQNLVAFQLKGHIYYKVIKPIIRDVELQVFYGDDYAKELNIDMKRFASFRGKENHKTLAIACNYCKVGFDGQVKLDDHLKKGLNGQFKCKVLHNQEMIKRCEVTETNHICNKCGKGFAQKSHLTKHSQVHFLNLKLSCHTCDKAFSSENGLNQHIKEVHTTPDRVFNCDQCDREFTKKSNMVRHMNTHLNARDYKCVTCGLLFSRSSDLSRHMSSVHLQQKSHQCPHCQNSFPRKDNLARHVKSVHQVLKESCTWPGCDYAGFPGERMDHHRRQVHTKEYTFECSLCEDQNGIWWGCVVKTTMTRHMKAKHPDEWAEREQARLDATPFFCNISNCDKRFPSKVEADRHRKKLH